MNEINEIAAALGISKKCIIADTFFSLDRKVFVEFTISNTIITRFIGIRLKKYVLKFTKCIFQCTLDMEYQECQGLGFDSCDFKKEINFSQASFARVLYFYLCNFEQKANFEYSTFEDLLRLEKTNLEQVVFNHCLFKDNAYFSNSILKKNADFHECKFEKTAGFYNTTFEKVPNFSQAIFNGNLNLVNANLFNFGFVDTEDKIKKEYNSYVETDKEKSLDKFANDFRDSFRLCKNALIKENNLIDASQWHKLELYAKEIELDSKKPSILSRDWIDKWILSFYRCTSDHHTDLVRIIHWVIILIGYFSLTLFLGKYNYHLEIFFNNHSNDIPINLTNDFINTMVESKLIYLISFIAYIGICLKPIRLLIGYIGTFLIITINPKYIFGIASIFSNKYHFTYTENIIIAIYSILMFLLLFSLQKTARKNSIVPH